MRKIRKYIVCILCLGLFFGSMKTVFAEDNYIDMDDTDYSYGALPENEVPTYVSPKTTFQRSSLPNKVNLTESKYFPPIGSQGSTGSCVAWATTYYQYTYMTAQLNDLDAKSNPEYRRSPKSTWNFYNGGTNSGTQTSNAYPILYDRSAVSMTDFPFDSNPTDWCTNYEAIEKSMRTRLSEYYFESFSKSSDQTPITSYQSDSLLNMKQLLNNGYPLVFATDFGKQDFQLNTLPDGSNYSGDMVITHLINTNNTYNGHALTIAGYDDTICFDLNENGAIEDFEKGAFLVVNSWGDTWQNEGTVWVMYDALNTISNSSNLNVTNRYPLLNQYGYYYMEVKNYDLDYIVRVTYETARRDDLSVKLIGEKKAYYYNSHANYKTSGISFDGTTNVVECTFVYDLEMLKDILKKYGANTKDWETAIKNIDISDMNNNGQSLSIKKVEFVIDGEVVKAYPEIEEEDNHNYELDGTTQRFSFQKSNIDIIDNYKGNDGIAVAQNTYDIQLTINGKTITNEQLLQVTWNYELLGGFKGNIEDFVNQQDTKITMLKSGIIKVTGTYQGAESSIIIIKSGDVSRDGGMNGVDATLIQRYNASQNMNDLKVVDEYTTHLADINQDGGINGVDATLIQRYNASSDMNDVTYVNMDEDDVINRADGPLIQRLMK